MNLAESLNSNVFDIKREDQNEVRHGIQDTSNNSIEQIRCDIMAKFKVEIERPLCISCESCNIEAAQSCPATCIHVYENGKKII